MDWNRDSGVLEAQENPFQVGSDSNPPSIIESGIDKKTSAKCPPRHKAHKRAAASAEAVELLKGLTSRQRDVLEYLWFGC